MKARRLSLVQRASELRRQDRSLSAEEAIERAASESDARRAKVCGVLGVQARRNRLFDGVLEWFTNLFRWGGPARG